MGHHLALFLRLVPTAMLVASTLGAASCRRIAPYGAADLAGPPDAPPSEGSLPDVPPPPPDVVVRKDLPERDTLPADTLPADTLPADTLPCTPVSTINGAAQKCAEQCVLATDDADCDGLPNGRDPSVTCQPLLLNEDFAQDPAKNPARWKPTGAQVTWSCGQATLSAGTTLTLVSPSLLQSTTAGAYLVELRFTLGMATDAKNWRVSIVTGGTTGRSLKCAAWMSTTYTINKPGAHLNTLGTCGQSGSFGNPTGTKLGLGDPGETYVLQVWHTGATASCRLLRDDGTLQQQFNNPTPCAQSRPDTFYISVTGREATLHHIRAFAYPN